MNRMYSSSLRQLLGHGRHGLRSGQKLVGHGVSSTNARSIVVKSSSSHASSEVPFNYPLKTTEPQTPYKPESKKNTSRLMKNMNKRSKRDARDIASKYKILRRELQDAIEIYNQKHQKHLSFNDFQNGEDIIEKFLFTKNRPYVELTNVEIIYHASDGDGLAIVPKHQYQQEFTEDVSKEYLLVKVPKTVLGDIVTVQLLMHHFYYAESFPIKVENPDSRTTKRKDSLVVCEKFNECSGCQLQMLPYSDQLDFKQQIIQRAFSYFYPEIFDSVDKADIGQMIPSPMEYAYRTKLTPHYTWRKNRPKSELINLNIGIQHANPTKGNVDITRCHIATKSLNRELPQVRRKILNTLSSETPKNPTSTALLRESIRIDFNTGEYEVICLTDPKKVVTEKVGDYVFQFPANEFFQNNNTILPSIIDYIQYQLEGIQYKNIIDTYCGSGFFGISLNKTLPEDGKVFGVEISKNSINYATHNAKINGLEIPKKIQFVEGKADQMFNNDSFRTANLKGSESIVIMDPSREGSDTDFLRQLVEFRPKFIIYVSCNVFTQARDIASFMELQTPETQYRIKDIRGFDFFPQTKHVESVAILELI